MRDSAGISSFEPLLKEEDRGSGAKAESELEGCGGAEEEGRKTHSLRG
jgi:hypothetical protein